MPFRLQGRWWVYSPATRFFPLTSVGWNPKWMGPPKPSHKIFQKPEVSAVLPCILARWDEWASSFSSGWCHCEGISLNKNGCYSVEGWPSIGILVAALPCESLKPPTQDSPQETPDCTALPPLVLRVSSYKWKICTLALEKGGFISNRFCLSLSNINSIIFQAGCHVGTCSRLWHFRLGNRSGV